MKTVVYIDALLLVNFIIAYFLLMAAGLLSGLHAPFRRMAAACAIAAVSSLILLAPEQPYPLQIVYKILTALAITATAFGWGRVRRLLAAVCWYAALNILLAGLALLCIFGSGTSLVHTANLTVYLQISPLLLMGCAAVCWAVISVIMRFLRPPKAKNETIGIELALCGRAVRLRAALDTGCHLHDPITCLPVLLVSYPEAKSRLPAELAAYLEEWFSGRRSAAPPAGLHLRLIPCATATGQTLLPGFAVSDIGIISTGGVLASGRSAVAFSPQGFGSMEYEALYGSDFL